MSEIKLKPCTFCGGEAKLFHSNRSTTNGYIVECIKCGVWTRAYNEKEYAIEAWNTRKPMERIVEQLKQKEIGLTSWAEDEAYKLGIRDAIEIVEKGCSE